MPPRISLTAALRRPSALFRVPVNTRAAQAARISTTKPTQALRDDFSSPTRQPTSSSSSPARRGPSSTTSAILDMDSRASSNAPPPPASASASAGATDPTNAASGIYEQMAQRRGGGDDASAASTFSSIFGGGGSQTGAAGAGAGTGTGTLPARREVDSELRSKGNTDDFARQMPRRWRPGDVYAPHDLSPAEMGKWRRARARDRDLVDMLGLKPLDMYRNFSVISEFMTPHGRIKKSADTGLRPVNQRKMAKAIRRAIGLGLHPSVHHHPEILARDPQRRASQNQPTVHTYKW